MTQEERDTLKPTYLKSLVVLGRYWYGGESETEHTIRIWINGAFSHKSDILGGPGNMCNQSALDWLEGKGYLPGFIRHDNGSNEPLWQYCDRNGISLIDNVCPVPRKKDL